MKLITLIAGLLGGMLAVAAAYGQMGMGRGGMMGMSTLRHQFVMHYGIEPKYAYKVNPLRPTAENVAAGRKLYETNCATCHGANFRGTELPGGSSSWLCPKCVLANAVTGAVKPAFE